MNPWKDRKKYVKEIGVVFGQRSQLWWDIPAIDSFSLLKDIYKIDDKEYEKTLKELVELLKLEDILNIPVRQLSLGNRMKCEPYFRLDGSGTSEDEWLEITIDEEHKSKYAWLYDYTGFCADYGCNFEDPNTYIVEGSVQK